MQELFSAFPATVGTGFPCKPRLCDNCGASHEPRTVTAQRSSNEWARSHGGPSHQHQLTSNLCNTKQGKEIAQPSQTQV